MMSEKRERKEGQLSDSLKCIGNFMYPQNAADRIL